jgi:transketolase
MSERERSGQAVAASLRYVPRDTIRRVRGAVKDPVARAGILADICRVNTLYMIMAAGSGHIGSSFSSLDIVTWLWSEELRHPNSNEPGSDTYFSSKGHDAPGLYAVLIALEELDFDLLHRLRRLHGLPGHPDVSTPHIVTNTGSLGMGISKAYGMARAHRLVGESGRIVVMTGDGELQEGQIWESLQPAANAGLGEITVVVDHNKYQSDAAVRVVSDLGPIDEKFRAFGWAVRQVDGHDLRAFRDTFRELEAVRDRPKAIVADTIKGRGVSFMEAVAAGDEAYRFHAGAPSREDYDAAIAELVARIDERLEAARESRLELAEQPLPAGELPARPQRLVAAYGDELVHIARGRDDIVVLDADLLSDCGIEAFKSEFPDRFIECGIAEQHMVSAAGGLALEGMLPIVHSFAGFLTTRANEQIYNNATERTRIIYVGTLAGVVPGGPGHSHQSVRDISAIGSVPGLTAIEPCDEREARLAIRWAIEENRSNTYLRFVNVPVDVDYVLPPAYALQPGRGVTLRTGTDAAIVGYGPILLSNAYRAAAELARSGFNAAVINLPWLNRIDEDWVRRVLGRFALVVTLDNHYLRFGQGEMIAAALARTRPPAAVISLGLSDIPVCGSNGEVLEYHGLDAQSIVRAVLGRHVSAAH